MGSPVHVCLRSGQPAREGWHSRAMGKQRGSKKPLGQGTRKRLAAEAAAVGAQAALRAKKTLQKQTQRAAKTASLSEKKQRELSKEVRTFLFEKLGDLSPAAGGAVLRSALDHSDLKDYREAAGIVTGKESLAAQTIVSNAAAVLKGFGRKGTLPKDEASAKSAVLAAVFSEETTDNRLASTSARLLKTRRSNVSIGKKRRFAALSGNGLWALSIRAEDLMPLMSSLETGLSISGKGRLGSLPIGRMSDGTALDHTRKRNIQLICWKSRR